VYHWLDVPVNVGIWPWTVRSVAIFTNYETLYIVRFIRVSEDHRAKIYLKKSRRQFSVSFGAQFVTRWWGLHVTHDYQLSEIDRNRETRTAARLIRFERVSVWAGETKTTFAYTRSTENKKRLICICYTLGRRNVRK